jgi:tRNA C32,U32 (ribose-2'-O)-methylase TrmJ
MKHIKSLLEELYYTLLEKDFFDTEDDQPTDKGEEQKGTQSGGDEGGLDFENVEQQAEAVDVSRQDVLKLKILWANLIYLYKLSRQLALSDDRFEPVYEDFQKLYKYFRDFVINFESFEPDKRKKFIEAFRKAFIETINEFKEKLDQLEA